MYSIPLIFSSTCDVGAVAKHAILKGKPYYNFLDSIWEFFLFSQAKWKLASSGWWFTLCVMGVCCSEHALFSGWLHWLKCCYLALLLRSESNLWVCEYKSGWFLRKREFLMEVKIRIFSPSSFGLKVFFIFIVWKEMKRSFLAPEENYYTAI